MVTDPSASAALALIVMVPGALKLALFAGLVILTVGLPFGVVTVTAIIPDVVTAPLLSVALAVIE